MPIWPRAGSRRAYRQRKSWSNSSAEANLRARWSCYKPAPRRAVMKFSVGYPLAHNPRDDALMTAEFLGDFARVAEECGYHSVNVTEHPIPGNKFLASGGHHAPDPF